jgi:hypothetical protein
LVPEGRLEFADQRGAFPGVSALQKAAKPLWHSGWRRIMSASHECKRAAELLAGRWLIHRWRMGPLVRELRRSTDPLFRQAGIDLDS